MLKKLLYGEVLPLNNTYSSVILVASSEASMVCQPGFLRCKSLSTNNLSLTMEHILPSCCRTQITTLTVVLVTIDIVQPIVIVTLYGVQAVIIITIYKIQSVVMVTIDIVQSVDMVTYCIHSPACCHGYLLTSLNIVRTIIRNNDDTSGAVETLISSTSFTPTKSICFVFV